MANIEIAPNWRTGVRELAPGVYAYIQAKGTWFLSNAGLIVGNDACIAIDSLYTMEMNKNLRAEWEHLTDKPVRYLVITHPHSDHLFGAHLFPEATIICHERCRELTLEMMDELDEYVDMVSTAFPEFDVTEAQITLPHVVFDRQLVIYDGKRTVQIFYQRPAHTVGDVAVYLPDERIVFAGDILFYGATPLCLAGSVVGWIQSLKELLELDADRYVPGHGPICGKEGVMECKGYLELLYEHGCEKYRAGTTAREAALSLNLGHYKSWGNSERVLANMERLFRELKGEDPLSAIPVPDLLVQMNDLAKKGG